MSTENSATHQDVAPTTEPTFDHRQTITTIEEANAATRAGLMLRIQPRAPAPTVFFAIVNGRWARRTAGRNHWHDAAVEDVRAAVKRSLARGENRPGVTVCDPEETRR